MRHFPRARALATPAITLAGVLALTGALALPSAWADPADDQKRLERQQRGLAGDIDAQQDALQQSTAELSSTAAALVDAKQRLRAAESHLYTVQEQLEAARGVESQLGAKLTETRGQLDQARADLAAGQAATVAQRDAVADTIADIYERGDAQVMAFAAVLDAQTPADVTRQMSFSDVVVGREDQAYADLRDVEAQLGAHEDAVEQAEAAVAEQQAQAAETVQEIRGLEADASDAEADVAAQVESTRAARTAARGARDADAAALEELRRQDRQIKKQILAAKKAAAEAAARAAAEAAARNQAAPATNGLVGGVLLPPTDGRITSPFGYRRHPIYGYWGLHDGTDFGVACGQPLKAAGAGRVLSTVYSSSYGNRLFLDLGLVDGKALTAVYNHLSGYAASPGDVVAPGETVGYVGSTGWSTGCHLHFTVLVDGEPVDPMGYLR